MKIERRNAGRWTSPRILFAVVLAAALWPLTGTAANIFWKPSVKTGSYSDPNNWQDGGGVPCPPPVTPDIAYFGTGTNSYNVTMNVSTNAGGITIADSAYVTLTIAAGQTYQVNGITLRGSTLVHPANPVPGKKGSILYVVGGSITNTGGTLLGDNATGGTLLLDGVQAYLASATVSQSGSSYGHLRAVNRAVLTTGAVSVRGKDEVRIDGTSVWKVVSGNSYVGSTAGYDARVVITNGSSLLVATAAGMYISGDSDTGTGRVYVAGSGCSFSGAVHVSEYNLYSKGVGFFTVGDGGVVYGNKFNVQKPGTFTLAGGRLVLVGGHTSEDPYCSFGLIEGTGTIEHAVGSTVTFGNGGTMSPGLDSIGTLTFSTNVNFNNYAKHWRDLATRYGMLRMDIDGTADGQYDTIRVLGGRTATFNGGTNVVTLLNAETGKYQPGDTFDLVIANTVTLTAAPTLVFSTNTFSDTDFAGTLTKGASGGILQSGQESLRLTLTSVYRPKGTMVLIR